MKTHAEMNEGPEAFERFRKALRTIVSIPKNDGGSNRKKPNVKKKQTTKR